MQITALIRNYFYVNMLQYVDDEEELCIYLELQWENTGFSLINMQVYAERSSCGVTMSYCDYTHTYTQGMTGE